MNDLDRTSVRRAHDVNNVRILVEPSDYIVRNAGDTAMMQVGIQRLSRLWPDARIRVLSDEPDAFPFLSGNVEPLDTAGRKAWFAEPWPFSKMRRGKQGAVGLLAAARRTKPLLYQRWVPRADRGRRRALAEGFYAEVLASDLLVVTGMGGVTDAFPRYARELMEVVLLAQGLGIPTAMFGQGIGPLRDAGLVRLARQALPRLQLLALREGRYGPGIARSLGVADSRIFVTGDDALELALPAERVKVGTALGVNVRVASYSRVDRSRVAALQPVLSDLAERFGIQPVAIPISRVAGEEDSISIRSLLPPGAPEYPVPESPEQVIEALRRCRVLVTGSYHAGVFALANGIPTIGLAGSDYYRTKFHGLANMFGQGCTVVDLEEADFASQLGAAIIAAWSGAEQMQNALMAAARHQVGLSRAAYSRLAHLVNDPDA